MKSKMLWVCGKNPPDSAWEFAGIFSTEELAKTACRNALYFVAPVTLDETLPDALAEWPGAYYPLAATETPS